MPAHDTCPRCKFPTSGAETVCRLCEAPLDEPTTDAVRRASKHQATTRVRRPVDLAKFKHRSPSAAGSLRAVPREDDSGILAWIDCQPFPPIPLSESSLQLTVGRTTDCDIVLPHHSISRCHGVFWVHNNAIEYRDRSSNGSYLNGKRVERAIVRIGDVITIGPYDLELTGSPSPGADSDLDGTSEIDFSSFEAGLIEETPMVTTLQGLEFGQKTGTLTIMTGRLRGKLVVRNGVPWFATLGQDRDEEAVLAMLELAEGRYTFMPSAAPGERSIRSSLTGLLLEYSRRADEGSFDMNSLEDDPPTRL